MPSFSRKSAFHGYFVVSNPYKRFCILAVVSHVSGTDTVRGHKGHVPPPFHHAHAHYTDVLEANYVAIIRACACKRTRVVLSYWNGGRLGWHFGDPACPGAHDLPPMIGR